MEGGDLGGTMRLGAYPAVLSPGSLVSDLYAGATRIEERHRHRYEVNVNYKACLERTGMRFSGMSPDGVLPEIIERPDHPWFVGVQYHPELKSKPFDPHPLYRRIHRGGGAAGAAGIGDGVLSGQMDCRLGRTQVIHPCRSRSVCSSQPLSRSRHCADQPRFGTAAARRSTPPISRLLSAATNVVDKPRLARGKPRPWNITPRPGGVRPPGPSGNQRPPRDWPAVSCAMRSPRPAAAGHVPQRSPGARRRMAGRRLIAPSATELIHMGDTAEAIHLLAPSGR